MPTGAQRRRRRGSRERGRRSPPRAAAALAGVGVRSSLSAMIGVLAGLDPKLAIAAALGLAFVLVALANLAVGVVGLRASHLPRARPGRRRPGAQLREARRPDARDLLARDDRHASEAATSLVLLRAPDADGDRALFVALDVAQLRLGGGPGDTTSTRQPLSRSTSSLFPIVYTAIREPKHMRWVTGAFVVGAALAAAYGLVALPATSAAAVSVTAAGRPRSRVTGPSATRTCSPRCSSSGSSWPARDRARRRAIPAGAALLLRRDRCSASAVYRHRLTRRRDRAGRGPDRRGRLRRPSLAPRRVGSGRSSRVARIGFFAFFATAPRSTRITTADGGSGRTDIWKVGWRMFEANPVHGVGAGNFKSPRSTTCWSSRERRPRRVHRRHADRRAQRLPGDPRRARRSSGCDVPADRDPQHRRLGPRTARDASTGSARTGLSLIARAVIVGLPRLIMAADFFLSAEFSKLLWLLLALGPALLGVADPDGGGHRRPASPGAQRLALRSRRLSARESRRPPAAALICPGRGADSRTFSRVRSLADVVAADRDPLPARRSGGSGRRPQPAPPGR